MDVLETIEQGGSDGPEVDADGVTDEPTVDGRSLRRQRNRDAVVEAAFELIRERRTTPTIDEVAERSGLSARSVFRYFDDTDDLISAVIRRQRRHLAPLWEPRVDPSGSLDLRIERFVAARVALVEAQGGVAWVARVRATDQPLIRTELNRVRAGVRRQVADLFAPELAALGPDGPAVLAAIDTLTSWEADDLLRRGHDADSADVADMMATSIRRLLAPAAVASPPAPVTDAEPTGGPVGGPVGGPDPAATESGAATVDDDAPDPLAVEPTSGGATPAGPAPVLDLRADR